MDTIDRGVRRAVTGNGPLLTAGQVAEMIGVRIDYVWRLCRHHEIPHVRFGRSYRFRLDSILEWLKDRESGPAGP